MRGTIVKKSNGRYYVATHFTDPETGKRKQRSHGGYRTKKEAQQALTEVLGSIDKGTFVTPSRRTVGSFLVDEWLPAKAAEVRPSTLHSYERITALHIVPKLGQVQLQDLTAPMLNAVYADLSTNGRSDGTGGLSARSVRYAHTILRMALADAVRWGYLSRNVADQAMPPKSPTLAERTLTTWDPVEVRAFLTHVHDDRLYASWLLAASTGMRRGEVLGLRWVDLDLANNRLEVRQQLTSLDYKLTFGPPKTKRGQRQVLLDAATITGLRAHRKRQAEERLAIGAGWTDTGLVFTRADGNPVHPDSFAQAFERHIKASGQRKIRFHDLRHTFATNALRAGVPPKVVSDILGHATVAFTMDTCTHAIPSMQADAVDLVANLVWSS
jgi:integrase